jgi:hypothetical protein
VGDPGSLPADDAELEPETASPGVDGLLGVRRAQLGAAEHVDDVERAACPDRLAERPKRGNPEDVPLVGVDRDAFVALVDQVAEDPE